MHLDLFYYVVSVCVGNFLKLFNCCTGKECRSWTENMAQQLRTLPTLEESSNSDVSAHIRQHSQLPTSPAPGDPASSSEFCGYPHSHLLMPHIYAHNYKQQNKPLKRNVDPKGHRCFRVLETNVPLHICL